jgi:hypothetical protein
VSSVGAVGAITGSPELVQSLSVGFVVLLQLATQTPCGPLSEGEKLTHELQLIEKGIREKEKELRLVCSFMVNKEVQDRALAY